MTFQPPSRSLTPRDVQFIALAIILFALVSGALVYLNLSFQGGGGEFYVHWVAARAFTIDNVDPYSGEIPTRTQLLVYEDSAKAGDEPYILDTPFNIFLTYLPFSLLSDPALARAIFTWLSQLALFALAVISLQLTGLQSPRWIAALFIVFSALNFYSYQALYEASPVFFLGLLYLGIFISFNAGLDELTGALLAFSCYYWEVGALFLLLIALRAYRESRTAVLSGFLMLGFILGAISFLVYPNWIVPFLRAARSNFNADFGYSIPSVFTSLLPTSASFLTWIFLLALVIILIYEFSLALPADDRHFYWTVCLALAAAPLLGLRTEMENLAVLIIPQALIFSILYDRWRKIGAFLTLSVMLVSFAYPWLTNFFSTSKTANEAIFLFITLFTFIGLYWVRWWATRPPRLWADQIKEL